MLLKCGGSGSKGNCYALFHNKQILLIDAGICIRNIKKLVDWDIKGIVGCVITHCHKDHSLSAEELKKMGIVVFEPFRTDIRKASMGDFTIQAFNVPHDETENFGFYIKVGNEKLLYLTDLEYCPFNFAKQKINHLMVECNHIAKDLNEELGYLAHKVRGHCELETTKGIVSINLTENLRNVILIHTDNKIDKDLLLKEICQIVPPNVNVSISEKWKGYELVSEDY